MSSIISFDDEIMVNVNEESLDDTRKKVLKYWEERENGNINDKLISMFKNGYEGDARTAVHMVVELAIYSFECERDLFEGQIDLNDERIYKYADFYDYLNENILNTTIYLDYFNFAVGRNIPPFLEFCKEALSLLTRERLAAEYDILEDSRCKKNFDMVMDFLYSHGNSGIISILSNEDAEDIHYCYKSAVAPEMNDDYINMTQTVIKNGLMKTYELGGILILIQAKGENEISYTGFKIENQNIGYATRAEIRKSSNLLRQLPDYLSQDEKLIFEMTVQMGRYYKPEINFIE